MWRRIEEKLRCLKGNVGLYYKDLLTGHEFYAGGEDRYLAASVIKLPVMVEMFRQIEDKLLDPDMAVTLKNRDKVPEAGIPNYGRQFLEGRRFSELFPESGVLNYLHEGLRLTVMDLCVLMILISDNTATNMLIDLLGQARINRTMAAMSLRTTRLNRKLFEKKDGIPEDTENWISLREMGLLLENLYRGHLISPEASEQMVAILTNQQFNYKIPFCLPNVPVAHKTGEDEGLTNDVGIVYGERVPFILCLAAYNTDVPQTERAFSEIAEMLYNALNEEERR